MAEKTAAASAENLKAKVGSYNTGFNFGPPGLRVGDRDPGGAVARIRAWRA